MNRFRSIIESVEDWVSGLLIVGGLFVLFYGVILRFLNFPTTWQDEIARFLVVWGALIGASVALRDNSHIRVDLLYQLFPNKIQRFINIFANIVSILFFMFLILYGLELVTDKFATGQKSIGGVPLWIVYFIIPLTGLMLTLRTIERLVRLFRGKTESDNDDNLIVD